MDIPEYRFLITKETREECQRLGMDPEIFLPTRSEKDATGWDVRCSDKNGINISPNCYAMINLGIKCIIPENWYLKINPRSSTFTKLHLQCLYGIVDFNYVGNMFLAANYIPDGCKLLHTDSKLRIAFGDRIAQLIPDRIENMEVKSISEEEFEISAEERRKLRGELGFGSSGSK